MKIGLLSDTHSYLDPKVFTYFQHCDEIWHAGDVGTLSLFKELSEFKPTRGVYGNIDNKAIQAVLPFDVRFNCEGLSVWMTHIGGKPPKYNPRVKKLLEQGAPDIFICGHSHLLQISRDPALGNMLYVNPGAAGNHGFHRVKTLVRFEILNSKIKDMEVIEMGKRGEIIS
jgi:putative phosphoesterase